MTSTSKWTFAFVLVVLAILPYKTTAAPAEVFVRKMKELCDVLNSSDNTEKTRKCIDELHEAAACVDVGPGRTGTETVTEAIKKACDFGTMSDVQSLQRALLKATADLYTNSKWPNVKAARKQAAELVDMIEIVDILRADDSLEDVDTVMNRDKWRSSESSEEEVEDMYTKTSERIRKEFHAEVLQRVDTISSTAGVSDQLGFDNENTTVIGILTGLLRKSTTVACASKEDTSAAAKEDGGKADKLIVGRLYVAEFYITAKGIINNIAVNMLLLKVDELCPLIVAAREGCAETRKTGAFRSAKNKIVALLKKSVGGELLTLFFKNFSDCCNWWKTERALFEVECSSSMTKGLTHPSARYDYAMQHLYEGILGVVVIGEKFRVEEKSVFMREIYQEAVREYPFVDMRSFKGAEIAEVEKVKVLMRKKLNRLLEDYLKKNAIVDNDLGLITGPLPQTGDDAERNLCAWKKHRESELEQYEKGFEEKP
eukprot:GHVS01009166.1.p1 GENE.GHVS01009166.1~~GHVS01009166.1.p1  ORF type:complete len:485 (-),score=58.44 GHVS01009166.1:312-1766(-)